MHNTCLSVQQGRQAVHLNSHVSNLIQLDAGSNWWLKYSSASDQNPGWIWGNCCGTLSERVNRVFTWLVSIDMTIICLPFSLSTPLFLLSIEHMERGEEKVNLKAKLRVLKAGELALNSNISDQVKPGEKVFAAKAHCCPLCKSYQKPSCEVKLKESCCDICIFRINWYTLYLMRRVNKLLIFTSIKHFASLNMKF